MTKGRLDVQRLIFFYFFEKIFEKVLTNEGKCGIILLSTGQNTNEQRRIIMIKIVDNRTADTRVFDELETGDFFEHDNILYIKIDEDSCLSLSDERYGAKDCYGEAYGFLPLAKVTKLKVTITIEGAE
jgi:hypothetical protein